MNAQTTTAFGELLKEHRLAAGLTQEALAEKAGVSARNIQNLERGENKPLKDTARRLAAALGLGERDRALLLTAVLPVPRRRVISPIVHATPDQSLPSFPVEGETALGAGMLAVLVADVRGYTAFTHAHGDEAGAQLATHFADLAGAAVAAEGGRVVEVRGDEVLAVFGSARAALRAAVGLLVRCAAGARDDLPLRAGVGVDVGEPVAVPGGYRGEVINTAARLCAQAGPGEVLASEAIVALARRVDGLAYHDRGALALKGLPRPVRAWLVHAAAGTACVPEADAPPPPAASPAARHNLLAPLSSFIGRERDRAKVVELLAAHRLVTLVGSGGVGKTRLALAVAESLLSTSPDGVWLVELAPLADPTQVPGALAQVLGLREEPDCPLPQTLAGYLRERRVLLLLDNCEHLVTACAALASALLRAAPGLSILATSREGLGVAGEQRYRVPSLSVPDPQHLPSAELAGSYEAVRLFMERAQERRDDFTLSARTARAVAAICARLDGIPLAIELAAARVGSLGVETIAARLDQSVRLLSGGGRDLPTRQRTLRAALDWSWDLLEEAERTLLARLSVFAGGWTLAAAEAVCTGEGLDAWVVLDGLDALVDKSLAQVDEEGEGAGRYRLLETVRQYAAERLAEGGAAAVRDRHLGWCLALATEAMPALQGAGQGRWLLALEAEHDNLRAALGWARESGAAEEGLQLAGALTRFWELRAHYGEGRGWLEELLAAGERGSPAARARALYAAGLLAYRQGDYARARAQGEAGLALQRELADRLGIASTLNCLGMVAHQQGDYAAARALHGESLALERELGNSHGTASSLDNLGNVAGMQGDYTQARALHGESLALRRELGDRWGMAVSLGNLGVDVERQGDLTAARALATESLALRRELGDRWGIALALDNLGVVAQKQGDYAAARALHEESLALRRELGDRWGIALGLEHLGIVAAAQDAYAQARALHGEGLALRRELGDKHGVADSLDELAELAVARGQPWRGARLWGAVDALRQAHGMPRPPGIQAEHERAIAALGAALGEEACAAAVGEGRAMALDEAVAWALATDAAG